MYACTRVHTYNMFEKHYAFLKIHNAYRHIKGSAKLYHKFSCIGEVLRAWNLILKN